MREGKKMVNNPTDEIKGDTSSMAKEETIPKASRIKENSSDYFGVNKLSTASFV